MNLEEYMGKKVSVAGIDGKTYTGIVDGYTQQNDNDGIAAISLSTGIWLDETDIKTIEAG